MAASRFLPLIILLSIEAISSQSGNPDWEDVLVVREGMPATLVCTVVLDGGELVLNWNVKPVGGKEWQHVLTANEWTAFHGVSAKTSMRLNDRYYKNSGDFSLFFLTKREDSGFYSCLVHQSRIHQGEVVQTQVERIILLAILTVSVEPAAPVPQQSTLQLYAKVHPDFAVTKITWATPGSVSMKTERTNKGVVAKVPVVRGADAGAYVCMVHPRGNSSRPIFPFNVDVALADKVVSFDTITGAPVISTATQAGTPLLLTCPAVQGDYVTLHWQPPDTTKQSLMKEVFFYDRWRGSTRTTGGKVQLAGPPYSAETGSFSFLLNPDLNDGGFYKCEVFLNDHISRQRTKISVLKVTAKRSQTHLELLCLYSELSLVQKAEWKYQNESRQLQLPKRRPGSVSISLPTPVSADTAGNYTCTLLLRNGRALSATYALTWPFNAGQDNFTEIGHVANPSLPPSLSALLLLVPLAAAAVGVLLWRQKHFSHRGIEQSLSVYSGEVENVYENPEDLRQAPPQGSVYMDLKPRGEDDVYKELERCEPCQG